LTLIIPPARFWQIASELRKLLPLECRYATALDFSRSWFAAIGDGNCRPTFKVWMIFFRISLIVSILAPMLSTHSGPLLHGTETLTL
jgi:hypothetical protein